MAAQHGDVRHGPAIQPGTPEVARVRRGRRCAVRPAGPVRADGRLDVAVLAKAAAIPVVAEVPVVESKPGVLASIKNFLFGS